MGVLDGFQVPGSLTQHDLPARRWDGNHGLLEANHALADFPLQVCIDHVWPKRVGAGCAGCAKACAGCAGCPGGTGTGINLGATPPLTGGTLNPGGGGGIDPGAVPMSFAGVISVLVLVSLTGLVLSTTVWIPSWIF